MGDQGNGQSADGDVPDLQADSEDAEGLSRDAIEGDELRIERKGSIVLAIVRRRVTKTPSGIPMRCAEEYEVSERVPLQYVSGPEDKMEWYLKGVAMRLKAKLDRKMSWNRL